MDQFAQVFAQFQDYLAPRPDVYEQAIYLFILRNTIIENRREATIGFKSARKKLAFGMGKAGTVPSEHTVYEKLRGLESKGCIKIVGSERLGTRVRILLPAEIPHVVPTVTADEGIDIETADFFSIPEKAKTHPGSRGMGLLLLLGEARRKQPRPRARRLAASRGQSVSKCRGRMSALQ